MKGFVRMVPLTVVAAVTVACMAGTSSPARAENICAQPGAPQAGSLTHDRRERQYRVVVPPGASADKPVPLIVALHGGWGTGDALARQSGLTEAAARRGFAVVYPNGVWRAWNAGSCCGKPANDNVDDVGFIRELVKNLGGESCIDGSRVFATGFSNGAMLTHRLACEAPELFRAVAPVAGGPMVQRCASERALPALMIVGREDERIPWRGGEFEGSYRPSMDEQVGLFARRNRCDDNERELPGSDGACRQRLGCGGGDLRWCVVDRLGHQWPGGQTILPRLLGANRRDINATEMILDFFADK